MKAVGFVTELLLGGEGLMHNLAFEGRAMAPGLRATRVDPVIALRSE